MGGRKIDLVQDRDHFQIVIHGKINIRQGLRFDSLGRVHDQDRSVAGGEGTGNFVIKVHMSGGVDQVEDIFFAVFRPVHRADGLTLDGDPAFPLQIHIVQDLVLHFTAGEQTCLLDDAVRQSGLAVVNMSYNAEIADMRAIG